MIARMLFFHCILVLLLTSSPMPLLGLWPPDPFSRSWIHPSLTAVVPHIRIFLWHLTPALVVLVVSEGQLGISLWHYTSALGMCPSLNPNVVGNWQFFCRSEIQRIFGDIYVGFGFLTFLLESLCSSFIAFCQQKIGHAKIKKWALNSCLNGVNTESGQISSNLVIFDV